MANPVLRGFRNLARFPGRDGRSQFWPYAGAVIALVFIGNGVGMSWMMNDMFGKLQGYAAAHPGSATVGASPTRYPVQVENVPVTDLPQPDFRLFFGVMAITVVVTIGLLAAAVARRLHDRNMAGFWGLMPVPFLTVGLTVFPIMTGDIMSGGEPDFSLFGLLFANNMIYIVALVSLVVLLAQPGTRGPNRYGADPLEDDAVARLRGT